MVNLKDVLLDLIFPPRCVVCDAILNRGEVGIHKKSGQDLFLVNNPVCMHCGRPLGSNNQEFCYDCSKKSVSNTFKQQKALFLYKGKIKNSMYRFKYANKREYGDFFGKMAIILYGDWIKSHNVECIVPVPMYEKKKKKRGYNQAEVFANAISEYSGIPVCPDAVIRVRNTKPMKNLNDIERKNNLKNAFQIKEYIVQYNYIMVVDDIYTTGATADAISFELLKAGVREVYYLSICIGEGF